MLRTTLTLLAAIAIAQPLQADWSVDNDQSRLSFVSTKAGTVAEVHHFTELMGSLADNGSFRLDIALASVETLIPIRNDRMREMLFQVSRFPQASLSASLDMAQLRQLKAGEQIKLVAEASLALHGKSTPLTIETMVARLDADTLLVSSLQPLVLNTDNLGLSDGVAQLREVAGLPSISPAVPVSFRLTLRQGPASAHAVSQGLESPVGQGAP